MTNVNLSLLILGAFSVGIGLVSQAGVNAQLREALHSPIQAAFISFFIGTVILGAICLFLGYPWFKASSALNIPWWAWLGGAFGAFNIAMSVFLAPKLGALALAISILGGQVIISLVYDQFGWLGYPQIQLSIGRLFGALLIVVGVVLVARG